MAGASAVLAVLWPEWEAQGKIPHPTTGRTWLLRVGLYKSTTRLKAKLPRGISLRGL
jgi:hypothetical protein